MDLSQAAAAVRYSECAQTGGGGASVYTYQEIINFAFELFSVQSVQVYMCDVYYSDGCAVAKRLHCNMRLERDSGNPSCDMNRYVYASWGGMVSELHTTAKHYE